MHITKKYLRDVKQGLDKRIRQVCEMTDEQLMQEFKRMWPEVTVVQAAPKELIRQMLQWALEASLPSHMVE